MKFVIVTGMSGAGKSTAVKCLEDLGFYCVDNLPPVLIPKFVEICYNSQGKIDKAAVVIDIRGGSLFNDFLKVLNQLTDDGYNVDILFLDASDNSLIKRYKGTRRLHPLSGDGKISDGIEKERKLLDDIRKNATHIIDTTDLLINDLKEKIQNIYTEGSFSSGLLIDVMSFGYKYGIPVDADLVFDVRFLPNPFYIDELKDSTGLKNDVQDYVKKWPQTEEFLEILKQMIEFLIPHYIEEGKKQLVIAIGCTGGMHRSVTMVEMMHEFLYQKGYKTVKHHRDIEKDNR